ncbi:MAG: alpha/beta hydrolase-fold protein [Devosia sp.]
MHSLISDAEVHPAPSIDDASRYVVASRMMRSALLAIALASTVTMPRVAAAQDSLSPPPSEKAAARPIVIGSSFELRSKVLGDVRRINVRLPDHYGEPGRRFPVLILLDGGEREDFLHIAGLTQITAAYGEGQELILVGVEGVDRRHDLTSPSSVAADRKVAPTSGGAENYRRFLVEELRPWIEARYPSAGRAGLIGESLAGLFVLETLLRQPAAFDDYIAISPSLWWDDGRLAKTAAQGLQAMPMSGRRLWLGFDEPAPPADQAARERALQDRMVAALRDASPAGLTWTAARVNEGHSSIYHPAALQALRALYPATRPGGG